MSAGHYSQEIMVVVGNAIFTDEQECKAQTTGPAKVSLAASSAEAGSGWIL